MLDTEIHITGDEKLLDYCQRFNIKCLTIENLGPGSQVLSREYITSINKKFEESQDAYWYMIGLCEDMKRKTIKTIRGKVEVDYAAIANLPILYLECHFNCGQLGDSDNLYLPLSRKVPQDSPYMKTARCYKAKNFAKFIETYRDIDNIEACVFDSSPVLHDKKWFDAWVK